ncbi:IQ domain-containing protein H-like [Patiria miniata]|uniref:IQCH-like ATP-grasp domain-containing protein n=1 Tax=Patiria miniata TaxID=46514 RepID=A0A914BKB6_PATMI|nr:IQ domain-containing protein H-like [Patiria miniata]
MTEVERRPEEVGEILVKVQEDLHHLKEHLMQKSLSDGHRELIDLTALQNAIQKTEDGIKAQSEKIIQVVNNRVTTLPSVDASSKAKTMEPSSFSQESVFDLSGLGSDLPLRRISNKGLADKKLVSRYTAVDPLGGGGGPCGPSPGQQAKLLYNLKAIQDPTSTLNRKVVSDNYGVSLPLIVDKRHKVPTQKVVMGSNVEHLAVLPKANRVDPQLIPPPISEKDARKGILSLMERGLIPPAAELTLDPSPVRQKLQTLHDAQDKKNIPKGPPLGFGDGSFNLASVKLDLDPYPMEPMPTRPIVARRPRSASLAESPEPAWVSPRSGATSAKSARSLVPVKNMEPLPPPTTPASEFKHLHHRFAIQHGRLRESSKDFAAFKQHYCLSWGNIVTMLRHLEKLLGNYAVPLAFINGDKLADLAVEFELDKPPTTKALLGVIMNIDDVMALLNRPGRRFLGPDGEDVAATKIQSTWRRYKDRSQYLEYRRKKWAAGVIAISWVMHVKMAMVRKQLKETRKIQLEEFRRRTKDFSASWDRIQRNRRVIVHIPSLGYSQKIRTTIGDFNIQQNQQMARLCDLHDPNVEVIYVSPVNINDETLQYYNKLLGLRPAVESGNVEDQRDMSDRFKIIVPEAINSFPTHSMCLSTLLKYSPRALQRIQNLTAGKEAYIVPGVMHKDDLSLAHELNLPILGCEPEVSHLYSTKSGSKRIFASAEVDVPPSDFDVYSLEQLHESLAQLVTDNLDVKRYLFKLDDEFDGRGIAYCDITPHLRCHSWAKKEAARYGEKWAKKWAQEPAYIKIRAEVPDILANNATPINKKLYSSWPKFLEAFLSQGGVIEACPPSDSVTAITVNILITPDGKVTLVSSGDQIHAHSPFTCWGLSVPQSSVDPGQLNRACAKVAKSCLQRSVMGYFAVDFVTFIDPNTRDQKLWAVDLNLWYDDTVSTTGLMLYVSGGTLNNKTCEFHVPPPKKERKKSIRRRYEDLEPEEPPNTSRYAVMSTRLLHTNLAVVHYSVFFQMCRAHGIGFDIKEKQGTAFTLIDSYKREGIGMLTVGEELQGTLASFARNLSVIHQEISAPNMQGQSNFQAAIEDIEGILGTTIQNMDRPEDEEAK